MLQRWGFRALADRRVLALLPWLGLAVFAVWLLKPPFWGSDAFTHWVAGRFLAAGETVYHAAETNVGLGYYFYPPPAVQLTALTTWLPFGPWMVMWSTLQLLALRWLVGSRRLAATLLLVPVVPLELNLGNVHLFLAVALALGMTRSSAWLAALPLTKLLPVPLLVRPSIRPLLIAGAVCAVSFALDPGLWRDWTGVALALAPGTGQNTVPVAWPVRLVLALVLVVLSRRASPGAAAWLVIAATWLTIPTMWINSATILLAGLAVPESRSWLQERLVGPDRHPAGATSPV